MASFREKRSITSLEAETPYDSKLPRHALTKTQPYHSLGTVSQLATHKLPYLAYNNKMSSPFSFTT